MKGSGSENKKQRRWRTAWMVVIGVNLAAIAFVISVMTMTLFGSSDYIQLFGGIP